jgi:hypothetical protein
VLRNLSFQVTEVGIWKVYKYPFQAENFLKSSNFFQKIVIQTLELQVVPETNERFFGAEPADGPPQFYNENIAPTCEVRIEEIPRFGRAKNVFGKWVYLVEGSTALRQHVKVRHEHAIDKGEKTDHLWHPYFLIKGRRGVIYYRYLSIL